MSSVYARLTICTLFNSRKCQVVMEMAANGIVNNSIPLVAISDEKQHTLSSSTMMEANGTSYSLLTVLYLLKCVVLRQI